MLPEVLSEQQEKKRTPGDEVAASARRHAAAFSVLAIVLVIGGMALTGRGWRAYADEAVYGGTIMIYTGLVALSFIRATNKRWKKAFTELAYEWEAEADDKAAFKRAYKKLKPENREFREFAAHFPTSQEKVDEVLTAAARTVQEAQEAVRALYRAGTCGTTEKLHPANLAASVVGAKEEFIAERDKREMAVQGAVEKFDRLRDLAKARGYNVRCWADYLPQPPIPPTTFTTT